MTALLTSWGLLVCLSVVHLASAKAKVIDVFNGGKGDILQLQGEARLYNDGKFRNAIFNNSQSKWNLKDSNGNIVIPYIITGRFDSTEVSIIKQAMRRIKSNTCIRFRSRRSERDYIDIQNVEGEGCYTNLGRLQGRSVLMLEANDDSTEQGRLEPRLIRTKLAACADFVPLVEVAGQRCIATEIVQHELLHVTGLWHEQMRYDRDKYIKVHYENILPGLARQFDIISDKYSTVYSIPYDYKSVMHYGKTAFARPGLITMETLDPKYTDVIGEQKDASPSDYQKVCNIYGCRQCSGGLRKPEREDGKPSTSKPESKPGPTPNKECSDKFSSFCSTMKEILGCNDYVKEYCCSTCNAGNVTYS